MEAHQAFFISCQDLVGFTQMVSGSTHDKGGTIDQVFVNSNLLENITVRKTRILFSDHDQLRIILKKLEKS